MDTLGDLLYRLTGKGWVHPIHGVWPRGYPHPTHIQTTSLNKNTTLKSPIKLCSQMDTLGWYDDLTEWEFPAQVVLQVNCESMDHLGVTDVMYPNVYSGLVHLMFTFWGQ